MHYFISYDITNNRLRRRIALFLKTQGSIRCQYSVWLSPDWDNKTAIRQRKNIKKLQERYIKWGVPTDSVYAIPVEKDYLSQIVWHGKDIKTDYDSFQKGGVIFF